MAKPKKRKNKAADVVARFVRPTEQREAVNDFQGAGAAVRVVPVIDTLLRSERITRAHWEALDYYRDQANRAEDDVAQTSSLGQEATGGSVPGSRIPAVLLGTPAILETARLERCIAELKPAGFDIDLLEIVRAVARDDKTLTQWCIAKYGGRERYDGKGAFVAIVPVAESRVMKNALQALRYAAGGIVR